ncbi:hypothetical protein V6Z54_04270 [Bacillus sp. MAG717A]|nr:hypothetical protein [Bacillus safensis]MCZ2740038.1 hypothetical protein [Bacillus safensis]
MNEHNKMEGTSAIKHKKELETLDTQRFLALLGFQEVLKTIKT